jgi:hypothetical protein
MRKIYSFIVVMLCTIMSTNAQFTTVSAAVPLSSGDANATCFTLTPPLMEQKGAVWNNTPIDLSTSFQINTRMYFGATDAGADGIAFMLQQTGTSYIGNAGAAMGYAVESWEHPIPSFIVEFDTWYNQYGSMYDPTPLDFVGFQQNASNSHTSATYSYVSAGELKPGEALNANIEDNQWHDVSFTWNATTHTMTVVITLSPGVTQTFFYTGDIVNNIFGGNPMVYWGFTAGTGGLGGSTTVFDEQKVCIITTPPPPPPPPPTGDCGQLRTQTPGGWGVKPAGNNPGTYLYAHFNTAFPHGLTVGSTYTIKLSTPQDVTSFLPSGGQAKALTQNYVNPTNLKNVLAGQLVALTLSVTFDQMDPNFGPAGIHLGDMLIGSGPFSGWTVSAFLAEANKVLGGVASSYTVQQVLETATAINENYVDGKSDNHFLVCPNSMVTSRTILAGGMELQSAGYRVGPNPSTGRFVIVLPEELRNASVVVTNASGVVIERRAAVSRPGGQTMQLDLSGRANGFYIVRIVSGGKTYTQKLLVQK